jgi:ABC-type transport system substrate-binding protein
LDRGAIDKLATEGYGEPTNQPFLPGHRYHIDALDTPEKQNVEEAKRLVADVYPTGSRCAATRTSAVIDP